MLLLLLVFGAVGCNLPIDTRLLSIPRPAETSVSVSAAPPATSAPAATDTGETDLGTEKNRLVLALPPSATPSADASSAAQVITSLLEKATGYKFVVVMPFSESDLIKSFGLGNAHIGVLSPFGYLMASGQGTVEAAFAREQDGSIFYGAQFIAAAKTGGNAGFTSYFDPIQEANLAEAPVALAQFADKKPCWTDPLSPSGYVVPLGYLADAEIHTLEPAFLASHPGVVRALYAGGICDFGATYVDARTYPGLADQLPSVTKTVPVIWRIPAIIPYDTLVYAHGMKMDMQRLLTRAFVDMMSTTEGKSAIQTLYGFTGMQPVQDSQYAEFRRIVKAAGLDLQTLIK
jgi:ABC-type phosphate/phosphonate transport system substrate-binding protein